MMFSSGGQRNQEAGMLRKAQAMMRTTRTEQRSMSDGLAGARLSRRELLRGLGGMALGAVALGAAGCAVPGFAAAPTKVPASGMSLLVYKGHSKAVNGLIWSPDGAQIASASSDNTATTWNATTGETLLTYKGHKKEVWDIGWSPDGARIVTGSADNTAQVWDAKT